VDKLTAHQLLAEAKALGIELTSSQLKRLRLAELVSRPTQLHPHGRRGSVTVYPTVVLEQLVQLEPLRRRERRFDHLVTLAWWHGLDVRTDVARAAIARILQKMSVRPAAFDGEPFDAAEALAADLTDKRIRSPSMQLMRRRLGNREDMLSVVTVLAALATRSEIAWDVAGTDSDEESLGQLVNRATGVEAGLRARLGDSPPWLDEEPDAEMIMSELQAAGAFDPDLHRVVEDARDAALLEARDDVRLMFVELPKLTRMVEAAGGDDFGGLGSYRLIGRDNLDADANTIATAVRMMLVLRRVVGREPFDGIRDLVADQGAIATVAVAILDRLPEYRQILIDGMLGAIGDQTLASNMVDDLRALADEDRELSGALRAIGVELDPDP
jgi:hypothetical protein